MWRITNPDYNAEWRAANPEKLAAYHARRAAHYAALAASPKESPKETQ
jgi:hypothetical protein